MTWPTESAGRWLEARGNARPRGMIVIARKGRNRIPLIGLLRTSLAMCAGAQTALFRGPHRDRRRRSIGFVA